MAFWEEKTLEEMTEVEWESLCDGCGRCCLMKLEDEDTGDIYVSDVRCQLLDGESCKCTQYLVKAAGSQAWVAVPRHFCQEHTSHTLTASFR